MISDFSRKDAKMQRRKEKFLDLMFCVFASLRLCEKKSMGLVTFVSFVPLCEKKRILKS